MTRSENPLPRNNLARARHKARIVALQALYEADATSHQAEECVSRLLEEQSLSSMQATFARDLALGVELWKASIDNIIARYAPAFPVEQLSVLDRNMLRIAIYELLYERNTPVKVAINEAVELAKEFGGENSPRFVNGVLGSVVAHLDEHKPKEERG